jgi:hypothetical protein
MLKARHDELLEHTFFSDPVASGSRDELQVVEMWKYAGVCLHCKRFSYRIVLTKSQVEKVEEGKNFRHASLPDDEVELWLAAKEPMKPPEPPSPDAAFEGGIRLL